MPDITFNGFFDGEVKAVRLSQPSGAANCNYYLMVDNYVWGQVNKMSDGWRVYFNKPELFTTADADSLIEIVLKNQTS
ncbi:hypothetical protein ABIB40_000007 [Pedobacter sp. UYP30]|uniref:hypothetical protein n=1 Tax=Pedobacter sp. UYP30 TaxID=1756400 RepID=UPI00339A2D8D